MAKLECLNVFDRLWLVASKAILTYSLTHFVMGGVVRGGSYGEHPSLDKLVDGDMVHSMDYRALYDQVTTHW